MTLILGLFGFSGVMWSAVEIARWFLPIGVLLYFYPVFLPESEIEKRSSLPLLIRYPLETAAAFALITLVYYGVAPHPGHRLYGLLGGVVMGLVSYVRAQRLIERRGREYDSSLGALSAYVRSKRWRSVRSPL